jgi:D-alanyl-D-alanine carboxypeptidase/D-alanyl-D-alanine-endopeptidase (penicillin-binding protein 4)
MKLITSFTALKYLGSQFEFVTTASLAGKNLVIVGSGDPLLGTDGNDFISRIVSSLKERNITELENVVVDSSVFEDIRSHSNWPPDQLNRPYSCEVSGLNYNANCVKISAVNKNGHIILSTEPQTNYVSLVNKVQSSGKNSAIGCFRTEKENVLIVNGRCRKPTSFDVAIENPAAFFGTLLTENLNNAGITVSRKLLIAPAGSEPTQLLVENKTPLIEVLKQCNKDSFQLAAESLLKTLGAKQITGGKAGSWQGGQKVITNYLTSLGAEPNSFIIDDGSGLSSKNKLTAAIIVRVISDAHSTGLWSIFRPTLAEGGVDGTLSKYFYQAQYRSKVFAKTGFINGVRALSGSFIAGDREYLFSILANDANFNTKVAMYDIIKAIIDDGTRN